MKEQIKEMTEIMRKRSHEIARDPCGIDKLIAQGKLLPEDFAETLYNAGYRKQKEGEWKPIMAIGNRVECSKCGEMGVLRWKYCPNCGAHMKGADT